MNKDTRIKQLTSREIQAGERRQQILDVAKKLFAEGGYHGTSMRAINKEVGMAEALTYHYFPGGKLEILRTIIQEGQEKRMRDINEFSRLFQDEMSLREALLLLSHKMTDLFIKDKELIQIVIKDKNLLDKEEWISLMHSTHQPTDFMVSFLSKHAEQWQLRKMDFQLALSQFISTIILMTIFGVDFMRDSYDQYIEKAVDFTVELWSK